MERDAPRSVPGRLALARPSAALATALLVLLVSTLAGLALPGNASAGKTQELMFQDDAQLLGRDLGTQLGLLDELESLGVDSIHAIVYWKRHLADPEARRRPSGSGADPRSAHYTAEKWDLLDSLVRETRRRGMQLLLTPAAASTKGSIGLPRWARRGDGSPNTRHAQRFFQAVARRYYGSYTDEDGGRLPPVRRWSFWNEPNQAGWIVPQYKRVRGKRIAWSPVVYRDLYRRGLKALRSAGHRSSRVYLGETAPLGDPRNRTGTRSAMPPGLFIRELACADRRLRRYRGREASRRKGCRGFRRSHLKAHGFNHHFYTKGRGQPAVFNPRNRDWFPIYAQRRLTRLLDRLASRGRMYRRLRVYNTEFGFQSRPPDSKSGVRLNQQAQYENESEYISYRAGRIRSFTHYLMIDDPCVISSRQCLGFQTGLKFIDGRAKPAFAAFAMPIVVRRTSRSNKVRVWGSALRRRRGAATELLKNGRVVRRFVPGNTRGYFDIKVTGRRTDRYQLRDLATGFASRVARASSRRIL